MPRLFAPITIGSLQLRNRIMRSATMECMADPGTGAPLPRLRALYRALGEGGVGLIVTGHAYVARSGKTHPEMSSIASDDLILAWREAIRPAQEAGARVMMQINHGGTQVDPAVTPEALSPSGVASNDSVTPRSMTEDEIQGLVIAYGQAARRVREAGLDGVQIHGAHGYLITQFLSPATNLRQDRWGGSPERRLSFLREVAREIRQQVGADYPVWIKLGVAGGEENGLTLAMGAQVARACISYGIDCIEISHARGIPEGMRAKREAVFLPMAEAVREAVGPDFPLALVYGFRSRSVMEEVLASEVVQIISMCRPLIAEPDLPNKLRTGASDRALCQSCGRCLATVLGEVLLGEGVACHNPKVQEALR
jgi:2,4-dienoyl-CoA reductase-like NADH-dependent reductase (Old Yellow Enzyme family)